MSAMAVWFWWLHELPHWDRGLLRTVGCRNREDQSLAGSEFVGEVDFLVRTALEQLHTGDGISGLDFRHVGCVVVVL